MFNCLNTVYCAFKISWQEASKHWKIALNPSIEDRVDLAKQCLFKISSSENSSLSLKQRITHLAIATVFYMPFINLIFYKKLLSVENNPDCNLLDLPLVVLVRILSKLSDKELSYIESAHSKFKQPAQIVWKQRYQQEFNREVPQSNAKKLYFAELNFKNGKNNCCQIGTGRLYFSTTTQYAASLKNDQLAIWNTANNTIYNTVPVGNYQNFYFSPCEKKALIISRLPNGIELGILYDLSTGTRQATINADISRVEFSKNGEQILFQDYDGNASIWNVIYDTCISAPLINEVLISTCSLSLCGRSVFICNEQNQLYIWKPISRDLQQIPTTDVPTSAVFSPCSTKAALFDHSGKVYLWDLNCQEITVKFKGHKHQVKCATFSPDGTQLLTGDYFLKVCLWDVKTGDLLRKFTWNASSIDPWGIASIKVSPCGSKAILMTGRNYFASTWDLNKGKKLFDILPQNNIYNADFSPCGTKIMVSTDKDSYILDFNAI